MNKDADAGLEQLVRQLLDRQSESRSLDYKAPLTFGPTKADKGEILKWLMAFANTRDGGYILVGVQEAAGRFTPEGIDGNQAASFDPTDIGNFAQNYCSVLPTVSSHRVTIDGADVMLLRVDEFADEPIVCTKDLHDASGKTWILRAGSIYVRTPDARCVAIDSGEAMRGFLDLAVQKRGDALLHQIRKLVGTSKIIDPGKLPDAYTPELESASELFSREKVDSPYWYVEVIPSDYDPKLVPSNSRLKEIRRESAVSIRGWDFPHIDREYDRAFESGIESVTHWARYHEAHRFYRSGLFTWRRQLSEDSTEQYQGSISYVSAIYSLTEFFIFANRYAPLVAPEGEFSIRVGVTGLSGRVLRSDPGVFFEDFTTGAKSFEKIFRLPVEEVRASHLELANESARQLFELYGLDISREVIEDWQKRFVERRF